MSIKRTLIALAATLGLLGPNAHASSNGLVISQVYGGGGNTGATANLGVGVLTSTGNSTLKQQFRVRVFHCK